MEPSESSESVGACAPGGWGVGKAVHSQPHGKGFCQNDGAQRGLMTVYSEGSLGIPTLCAL